MVQTKIFVGVGTHSMPFERLLKKFDELVENGELKANIFAQTGSTNFNTKNFKTANYISEKEMINKIIWADIVISHSGAGYIINTLANKKPLIIVPRLKKLGEHTDDHQLELAKILQKEKRCIAVMDINDLNDAIIRALKLKSNISTEKEQLIKKIDYFLASLKK